MKMKFVSGSLPSLGWTPKGTLAPGNGPVGNSRGTGMTFHLGTNTGTWPWCGHVWDEKPGGLGWSPSQRLATTSRGPLFKPDKWCKACLKRCREIHGKGLKVPPPLTRANPVKQAVRSNAPVNKNPRLRSRPR